MFFFNFVFLICSGFMLTLKPERSHLSDLSYHMSGCVWLCVPAWAPSGRDSTWG